MKKLTKINSKQNLNNIVLGDKVIINDFVNLYGCQIGNHSLIGPFVEIQKNVIVGELRRFQSLSFNCEGVILKDRVFIGHGVMFINDNYPSVKTTLDKTWKLKPIIIEEGASIGSGAIILGGVNIGKNALIGAGAVVTHNVKANTVVTGIPARKLRGI